MGLAATAIFFGNLIRPSASNLANGVVVSFREDRSCLSVARSWLLLGFA